MALPGTRELESAIVDILSRARDDGRLGQLTVRIVRQELATRFDLDEDVLNGGKYKSFIKDTVHATLTSNQNILRNASDKSAEESQQCKVAKKEKSEGTVKGGSRKGKSKAQVHASDRGANAAGSDAPPSKNASVRLKPSKPVKPGKTLKKPESEMKFKSKAIIESSDEEVTPESGTGKSACLPKEQVSTRSPPPKRRKQQQKANKNVSDVNIDTGEGPGGSSPSSKPKHATESPKTSVPKAKEVDRDLMESELSSVVDEPPPKRQRKQEKDSAKPPKDERTKRGKKKEVLSKDEETVNKLKGIVVACGIRKVWKKEFEGLDKSSQQIKRLHSILGDLGMTPRYSLEKAKAIREQRELAQELEDVQEFEKATKRRGRGLRPPPDLEESSDQGDSDTDMPTQKRQNARASIMAFLQDQSEEE